MITECPVCRGTGLVGAGPEPHLHQGMVITCGNCGGSGQVETGVVAEEVAAPVEEAPVVEAQTPSSEEIVPAEGSQSVVVESVDNTVAAPVEESATLEVASESVQ